MELIEEIRNKYYKGIELLTNEDDISNALPFPNYTNFFPIVTGLIKILEDSIQNYERLIQTNEDEELTELYKEELIFKKLKLKICNERLKQAEEIKTDEVETLDSTDAKTIVFASTSSGRSYLEQDLKYVPEEYYSDILDCINDIEIGRKEENIEISRPFNSNNKKLKGLHEIKRFKIRLAYTILSKNIIYVMIVRQKKDDNATIDRDDLINRRKNTEDEFLEIKKIIKDENAFQEFMEKNNEIKKNLIELLEQKKRGNKSGRK